MVFKSLNRFWSFSQNVYMHVRIEFQCFWWNLVLVLVYMQRRELDNGQEEVQ